MTNKNYPVVLVDGSSYLFRAFHALPPLNNSKGQPTGAVKGVVNMIRSLVDQYPDSTIAVIFDAKGPTFRNEMYSEYKANRPPMPDELRSQIQPIHDIINAMGLPLISISGVEADDVIGTFATQATASGHDCLISTGDKDMAQLVSPHVTLVNTMKNEFLDPDGVTKKYGFGPEHIIDYLALMGDKVDNIPGVPGVGDKTATALIAGLGGLDDLYDNLEKIKDLEFRGAKTMHKKLEEHKDSAYLSYQLATIKCDVELEQNISELKHSDIDNDKLLELFTEMEFRSWVKQMGGDLKAGQGSGTRSTKAESNDSGEIEDIDLDFPKETDAKCIVSNEGLNQLYSEISRSKHMALNLESTKGHYLSAKLLGLSVSAEAGKGYYIPFLCTEEGIPPLLDEHTVFSTLKPLLESYDIKKIGHDFKAIRHKLRLYGIKLANAKADVFLKSFVIDSTLKRVTELDSKFEAFSADNLFRRYLNAEPQTLVDIAGPFGAKQTPIENLPLQTSTPYMAQRADHLLRLNVWLDAKLSQQNELKNVFTGIEQPLVPVLTRVEQNGAFLDKDYLKSISDNFKERANSLEKQAHDIAGEEFNLDSPKQLGKILFEKLELPVISKTKTGQPSTNEEVLSELALTYDLPKFILEYRHLRKLIGTYTDPLPTMINEETGRIHTTYNQAGAATGRFSSNEPNLQNIPIRSEEGHAIRRAFVAPKGYKLVAADYSQVELRIMTHLSQDQNLITAFKEGKDIHRATAAEVFDLAEDEVSSEQRRSAKAINFGLIYGMGAFGLAKQLGIGRKDAQQYVNLYFERYPGVKRYMDETRTEAAETGYVETIFGRRLYLPDIKSSKHMLRQAAERTAINAPMQGTAADIIKRAMIDVQTWLDNIKLDVRMIMQVHDELVFEVAEQQLEDFVKGVRFRMQSAANLDVPLVVDVGVGDNWDEAH